MFNKTFGNITDQSIWLESSNTVVTWVTLMAKADKNGKTSISSERVLAHMANLSLEEVRDALEILEAPNPDDFDQDFEGRKIKRLEDGWLILDYKKWFGLSKHEITKEGNRLRQAKSREKKKLEKEKSGEIK